MRKAQDQNQRGRRDLAWAAALAAWLVVLIIPAAASASDPFSGDLTGGASGPLGSPTIRSDKADYAPGETVILTGDNWLPGEHVHIRVNDNVGQSWVRDSDVNADASGYIRDEFQLPTSFIAEYAVTATGDASGTAQTTFTDGNVRITANLNADVTETPYNATGCTGSIRNNFPKTETASSSPTGNTAGVGAGNTESVRFDAAEHPDSPNQTAVFDHWEAVTSGAPFSTITGTGGRGICVPGFQGDGTREYRIIYTAANSAPTVTHNNASVTVNEGQTATNTGTWADANAGDTVTLSASVGTVTKNAGGTWSWSFPTTDGPDQSQTVTITATDNHGASSSVTFALTVANVAPVVTAAVDQTADEGMSKSFDLGSFTDPGADGPWAVTVDWGDGSAATTFTEAAPGTIAAKSHTYADDGEYTVSVTVAEAGAGTTPSDTKAFKVTVANVAPTAKLANNGPVDEGSPVSVSFSDQSDPSSDDTTAGFHYAYACDGGSLASATYAGSGTSDSKSCTFGDNGTKTVRARIIDKDGGYTEYTTDVTVRNVNPTTSNASFTLDPITGTAIAGFDFSDAGWLDTHGPSLSYFTWSDVTGNRNASVTQENVAPDATGHASDTWTLGPGCYNLTVTGTAKDDDGGESAARSIYSNSAASVYGRGFRPPIVDNERNIAKYGNVVPVKVVLTNTCTGATVTSVPLFITVHLGTGGETFEDTSIITESVSSADSGSQMRTADGMYIYNLSTKTLQQGRDYAIRIRPNSITDPWILQAVVYPKK